MISRGFEFAAVQNEVRDAHDHSDLINSIFEMRQSGRIYNPLEDELATSRLKNQISNWKEDGSVVVMSFGCYDAPFHPNHQRFLLDCKLQGVQAYYDRYVECASGEAWKDLDLQSQTEFAQAAFADGAVRMIVSADGDQRVSASKGFRPDKGNSNRPILGWSTRADNILGLSVPIAHENRRVPVVDAVTVHDHIAMPDALHASTVDMIAHYKPDVWALFHEAEKDIAAATEDTRIKDTDIVVIRGARGYELVDPLTGRSFSTTDHVRRIMGQ